MTYYRWDNLADFETWHAGVKVALGIPHPNENMATGEVAPEAQWTTSYTVPKEVGPGDVRAFVDDEVAAQHAVGLGAVSEMPPEPDPFSWSLDLNHDWQPPTPMPTEGDWYWDKDTLAWVEVTP